MRSIVSALLVSSAILFVSGPLSAQTASDPIESYCATMGKRDHFASDGYPLDNAAAIIRQDRANFHAFGKRDPSDEDDSTFSSKANRAALESWLRAGSIDADAEDAIVNGTPDVCIDIFPDYINVVVL